MQKKLIIINILALTIFSTALYADTPAPPFYPNWKLLKQAEKTQFMAGYLQAWKDAGKTLEIVGQYVRENPDSASNSVEKIKKIYDFNSLKADTIVREVDAFYGESENQSQPLSIAITTAKSRLR